MVFSEALHKSNVRMQKKKKVKKGNIDKRVYMFLIRCLKTKKVVFRPLFISFIYILLL